MSRDDSNLGDDSSSIGAKDDDDDDDDDDGIEEGSGGDPERLKAFNVSIDIESESNGEHIGGLLHRCYGR